MRRAGHLSRVVDAASPEPEGGPRRRRRRVAVAVAVLVVVLGAWAALVARSAWVARSEAREAVHALAAARREASLDPDGPATARLRRALAHVEEARSELDRPWMTPLRILPVAGRQIDAAESLSESASLLLDTAITGIEELGGGFERRLADGPQRVDLLRRTGRVADAARARLAAVDLGPSGGLIRPLADARHDFDVELARIRSMLDTAATLAPALADVFEGPRHYLVLAANNAEMRAGSGMFLMAGELVTGNGSIGLTAMRPTSDLTLAEGVAVNPEVDALWSWLGTGREWRNLGATPRFDVTAE
ncbi:MAG TPA: DUF4012 domain-containing protein, partial [Acidimicrobiia bacterium]|nr:DUF4012 domain-containing protein [Acidimicrobiia bacterium]